MDGGAAPYSIERCGMSGALYRLGLFPVVVTLHLCCAGVREAHGFDEGDKQTAKPGLLMLQRLDAYLEFKADYRYDRVGSAARIRYGWAWSILLHAPG